jgi:hypothetical protein
LASGEGILSSCFAALLVIGQRDDITSEFEQFINYVERWIFRTGNITDRKYPDQSSTDMWWQHAQHPFDITRNLHNAGACHQHVGHLEEPSDFGMMAA